MQAPDSVSIIFFPFRLSFKNSKFYLESDLQPQGIDHQWGEFTDVDLPDNISENSPRLISCYRIIRNKIAGEIDYAYYISITSSEFADTIKNHFVGTPINGYIVSSDGDQIASNVLQKENTFTPQMAKSIIEDNMYSIGNYQYVVTKFSKTNWYFISEIPNSYIQNYVTESMGTTILGIVIVFFVAIVAIFWITNRLTTRINFSIRIVKEYGKIKRKFLFRLRKENRIKTCGKEDGLVALDRCFGSSLTFLEKIIKIEPI